MLIDAFKDKAPKREPAVFKVSPTKASAQTQVRHLNLKDGETAFFSDRSVIKGIHDPNINLYEIARSKDEEGMARFGPTWASEVSPLHEAFEEIADLYNYVQHAAGYGQITENKARALQARVLLLFKEVLKVYHGGPCTLPAKYKAVRTIKDIDYGR